MLSLACPPFGCVDPTMLRGLGAYGSGAFTCTANICTGKYADVSATFRRLQTLVNQAAQGLGIGAPIAVDGKIGPGTVQKLMLVATTMPPRPDLPLLTASSGTPASVAANAQAYVAELEALISGELQFPAEQVTQAPTPKPGGVFHPFPSSGASTPVQTPGVPGAGPHVTEYASPGIMQLPPAARIGFAVAAVAVLGAVLYKVRKDRRSSAPVAGWFRRRRRR